MNLILNHLDLVFYIIGYLMIIGVALIIADWIGLRFDITSKQKCLKTAENASKALENYKLYYEAL